MKVRRILSRQEAEEEAVEAVEKKEGGDGGGVRQGGTRSRYIKNSGKA